MPSVHEVTNKSSLEAPANAKSGIFRSHWQVFVPTIVVIAIYGTALLWLWSEGRSGSGLFRLSALVLAVGAPLLATHAFLRYQTVRVRIKRDRLLYHQGWPKDTVVEIPYELIAKLYVKRGLGGRLLRSGTLIIETIAGNRVAIPDLKKPGRIVEAFNQARP